MSKVRFVYLLSIFTVFISCNQEQEAQRISLDSGSVGLEGREVVLGRKNSQSLLYALPLDSLESIEKAVIDDEAEKNLSEESNDLSFSNFSLFLRARAYKKSKLHLCLKQKQKEIFKETIKTLGQNTLISKDQLGKIEGHGDREEIFSRILAACRLELKEVREVLNKSVEEVSEELKAKIDDLAGKNISPTHLRELKRLLKELLEKEDFLNMARLLEEIKKVDTEEKNIVSLLEEFQKHLNDLDELSEASEKEDDIDEVKLDIRELKSIVSRLDHRRDKSCFDERQEILRAFRKLQQDIKNKIKEDNDSVNEELKAILEIIKESKQKRVERIAAKDEATSCKERLEELKRFLEEIKEKVEGKITSEDEKESENDESSGSECRKPEKVPECVGDEVLIESTDENGCLVYICQGQVCPVPAKIDCESYGMKTIYIKDSKGCEKAQCQQ